MDSSTSRLGGRSTARIGVVQSSSCSCLGRGDPVVGMPHRTDRFAVASVLWIGAETGEAGNAMGRGLSAFRPMADLCSPPPVLPDRGRVLLAQPLLAELGQLGSASLPLVARRVAQTLEPHARRGSPADEPAHGSAGP